MKRSRNDEPLANKIAVRPISKNARELTPITKTSTPPPEVLSLPSTGDIPPVKREELARISASPKNADLSNVKLTASSKNRKRRRHKAPPKNPFVLISLLFTLFIIMFYAGFFWESLKSAMRASAEAFIPINHAQQDKALNLIDDLMQAKHEGRFDDAKASAQAARQADPHIPGVEIVLAELALVTQKSAEVEAAAAEALRRGQNQAEAKLLLALEKWMTRGTGTRSAESMLAARQLAKEASAEDISNMTIMYFRGDMERYSGDKSEAHKFHLGSLYRQRPWLSNTILSAKMQLAAEDANAQSQGKNKAPSPIVSTPSNDALLALRKALQSATDTHPSLAALRRVTTDWQMKLLLDDRAFDIDALPPAVRQAKTAPLRPLPGMNATN